MTLILMRRLIAPLLLTLVLVGGSVTTAVAAELRRGDQVVIPANETIDDDLYATGQSVTINGNVTGDVLAAANTMTIAGRVGGDVLAAGSTIHVPGRIDGSFRTTSGTVDLGGSVGHDVIVLGHLLSLGPAAQIGRDLVMAGTELSIDGDVGRHVMAANRSLTIAGQIAGDVHAQAESIHLTDGATVTGDLRYSGENVATIDDGAVVYGSVSYQPTGEGSGTVNGVDRLTEAVTGGLRAVVGFVILGVPFVLLFPRLSRRAAHALHDAPGKSVAMGIVTLVGAPLLAVAVFVAGLFVGGWWLGPLAVGLYALAGAVGVVIATLFFGQLIAGVAGRSDARPILALVIGLGALALAMMVPYLGPVLLSSALIFGLGALLLGIVHAARAGAEQRRVSSDPDPARAGV